MQPIRTQPELTRRARLRFQRLSIVLIIATLLALAGSYYALTSCAQSLVGWYYLGLSGLFLVFALRFRREAYFLSKQQGPAE